MNNKEVIQELEKLQRQASKLQKDIGTLIGTLASPKLIETEEKKPEKHTAVWDEFVEMFYELFPNKINHRTSTLNGKYRGKFLARMRDPWFREQWREALTRAAQSAALQNETWFQMEFFLRNDENPRKCYDRFMQWKEDDYEQDQRQSVVLGSVADDEELSL